MQVDYFQAVAGTDREARGRSAGSLVIALVAAAALASACANEPGSGLSLANAPNITGYVQASALSRTGYKVSGLDGGGVRVTATGSAATPRARVEKIAMARAAEYGLQQKYRYFQATPAEVTIQCGARYFMRKGERVEQPAAGYTVAVVDVTYAKTAADPAFLPTKDTAKQLKAELAADPALSAPATVDPEIANRCGLTL